MHGWNATFFYDPSSLQSRMFRVGCLDKLPVGLLFTSLTIHRPRCVDNITCTGQKFKNTLSEVYWDIHVMQSSDTLFLLIKESVRRLF